eukprot:gene3883-4844_t
MISFTNSQPFERSYYGKSLATYPSTDLPTLVGCVIKGGDSNGNLGEYGGVTRDGKHFDIHQFCELLNDHRSNSAECTGKDCVFFIGDTGAGKTLTIQYAAGCQTRFENFRVQDDFGETFERRLVVQDPLPGFVVGDSADSQTKFVQCHHTLRGLTLCDTPGFSDTQGRTVDAANAVAVMDAICGCRTVRIVLVVDTRQLDRKAGYIKSLLELLSVFLSDVHTVKGSVLAVFTHLDAGSDWRDLARKINKLKDARALDDADIRMFLDHLMHLLKTHQDHLIVRPAATDAAERRNSLFAILQQHMSLELACADLRAGVEEHLRWSRPLDNLRQLRDLRLLSQILGDLAAVTRSYSEAVVVARTHVEGVLASAAQALQEHRFTCAAEDLRSLEGLESLYPHTEHDSAGAAMPVLQTKADCVTSQLHALAARLFDRAAHTETRFEEAAGALAPLRDVFERLAAHLTTEIRTRCSYDRAVRLLRERVLALAAASSALIHTEEGTEGGANAALGDPTALLPLDAQLCALRQSLHLAPHLGENLGARGQGVDCEALYQLAQRELDTALQCLAAASQLLGELEPRWSGPEASHATQRSILRAALEWLPALQRAVAALRAHLADSGGGADADLRRCLENRDRVAHHLIDALPAACEQEAWAEAAHCLVCIAVVVEMCPESDVQRQPLAERLLEARAQTVRRVDALAGRIHLRLEQGELGLALQGLRSLEVALERLEVEETLGRGGAETVARLEGERNSVRALLEQQASCALSGLAECVRRSGAAAAADAEECIKLSRASCLADRLRELERLVQAEVEHAVPGFEGRVLEVLQSLCGTLVQDCRECLAAVGALGKVVGGGEGGWKGSDAGGGSSSEPLPLSLLGARNHLQWLSDCVAELAPLVPTQDPETGRAPDDSRGESVGGGSPAPVASLHNITNKKKEKKRKKKTQARDEGNRAHGEAEAVAVAPPPCGTARSRPTELLPRLATMQIEVATNEGDPARCRAGSLPVHAHASWPSVLVSTIRAFQVAAEAELAALAMAQGRVAVECLHNDPPRISAVLGVSRVLQQLQCLDPLLGASPGCQQGSEGRHAEPSLMPLGAGAPERLAAPFAAQVEAVGAAELATLKDDVQGAMFEEAWLRKGEARDLAEKLRGFCEVDPMAYNRRMSAFLQQEVHAKMEGMLDILFGSKVETRVLLKVEDRLELLGRYASIFNEQAPGIEEARVRLRRGLLDLLDERYNRATCAIHAGEKQTVVHELGPLLKASIPLLRKLLQVWQPPGLEGTGVADDTNTGVSGTDRAEAKALLQMIEKFIKHTLDLDTSELSSRSDLRALSPPRPYDTEGEAGEERLEALEGDLEGILERCDYITLDRFFNGVSREFVLGGALDAAVDGAAQHDDGSGGWEEFEVGDRYPALLQALEQELLRRREAVTRHMQSHDIRQGCAELQWLRSIMRATIARSTLLGDELQVAATRASLEQCPRTEPRMSDANAVVQGFALERPGLPVEELGTFLQHLKREKAFIERTMGLDEYISHQEAMGVIAKRLRSVGALAEAAWGKRSQEPRLGTLVTIIQNLEALREQDELREECASPCRELQEWLAARTRSLAEEAQRTYSEATRATQAVQHQALTSRVNELMESHAQLVQCVAEARVIGGSGAGSPHGCPLRESSLEHKINLRTSELAEEVMARMQRGEHALGGVTADEVAQRLLAIYGTAADLSDAGIKAHAMECIDKILTKCQPRCLLGYMNENFNVAELTSVGADTCGTKNVQTLELLEAVGLELGVHDLGNEVVGRMPHFEELRLAKFDEVTACMSASDTLRKLTALNSLSEERAAALKSLYNVFDARYKVLCRRLLVRRDLAGLAHEARTACSSRSVEGLAELIAAIFAIWSYSSAQPKAKTLKKPLPAQVLALFQLLDLSRSDTSIVSWICAKIGIAGGTQPRNHFAQIKTGQGKSLVLGVLATVLAVLGYSVDVVCYSQYLVDRDRAAFDQLFELFGVERLVRHGTFQALSQLIMNEDGDIRLSTKKLLTRDTDTSSTSAAASKGRSKAPAAHEKQRILLIDEVDVFFSSEFYGTTYDPIMHVQGDHVAAIQFFLWEHREKSAAELLRQLRTEKCTELAALTETMGGAMGVVDGQLDLMVRDLKALLAPGGAESYPYSIKDGRIAYRVQDTVATDVSFGYATMWSYLVEHGRGRVNDTTLQQSLGLRVSCGQLSYAEIPKRYDTILGVTGTLVPESPSSQHPLGAFEQAILEKEYGIVHKTEMPSIFGESQLTFRERNDVHVEMDEAQYNRRIKEEIVESTARGRAVLVFFESEAALQRWRVTEYCTSTAAGLVEVVTAATSNIDHYITRATRSGCATLLSREHGRGLDFVCHDRTVEREGGVHVVQTFLSEVVSEELQIRGRTARQEKKGTFKLVLHAKSLEKYGVSEEDLTRLQLGGPQTLYAFLHEKRAVWLERSSEARREQVVCAKALHDQTVKYQKNLRVATNCMSTVTALNKKDQKVAAAAAAECLSFLVERNRGQRNCRLVCLSDATSSMSKVWDTTLHTIREMLERVGTVSGSRGNIEVRWVAYRDYDCEGSSRSGLLESSDWTDDPASLVRFVSGIRCHGGADYEEAVEAGLQFVNNEDTPPTRVLLIGDAPPHKEVSGQKLGSHRDRVLATDYRKECAVLAAKGVKVFPFYLHDNAKTAFEEIARITGGAAEALSGSDSHALLDAVCLNALDDIGGLEMQQLYRAQYQ